MAELTVLEEKLAEVLGLTQAAVSRIWSWPMPSRRMTSSNAALSPSISPAIAPATSP